MRVIATVVVPDNELCMYLFDAASSSDLAAACRTIGLRHDRIAPVELRSADRSIAEI